MNLRLVPDNTNIKFLGMRKVALAFSMVMILASALLFFTRGLNYGIDFQGGVDLLVQSQEGNADIPKIRSTLSSLGLGDIKVKEFGDPTDAMISIVRQPGGSEAQNNALNLVRDTLSKEIPTLKMGEADVIGPSVSGELKQKGTIAVTIAVLMVLIYIWFRFEWQFGLGAVIALVHDVLLTIGFFSITQLEFNLSIIAALLTIVGYSLNDTVVVYDRVRENIRKFRKRELEDVIDMSLNQTLARTIMTSVTTLLALFALFFFGGPSISGFTAAMIWGVFVGTYSSVFVASPMLVFLKVRSETLIHDDDDNDPTVDKSRPSPFEQF
ncbi:protein translocase subunit SecF [Kordiimonas laminariae]|uniref:protein translocase subunit SecF n=1 Tax=Kordiimonas laminariae TaxID=2917717 RepID=UPI001FF2DCD0|nr:protein translocase subunit SecF [Kordiimonas laminariae]MCK0070537.1 protein translocase subunit SecF [Kordiimonas laminariae]